MSTVDLKLIDAGNFAPRGRVTGRYSVTFQELADTTATNARGSDGGTTYLLEPREWLREIVDAAKKNFLIAQNAYNTEVQRGYKDIVIPKRTNYLASGSWSASVTPGTAVSYTTLNNLDGVTISPAFHNKGIAVTYDVIQTNAVDYMKAAQEELIYAASDRVELDIIHSLNGGVAASSGTTGYQTLRGGDATQASDLTAGDVLTPDLVSKAILRMRSNTLKYWSGGNELNSTAAKNTWSNENDFVLYVAPEQEHILRTSSQFTNASEYGGNQVIQTGQIGDYLGVKIIVSPNIQAYNSAVHRDGTTTGVNTHACFMAKAQKTYALAWQVKPTLHIVDYARELEKDIILEMSWGAKILHSDALVFVDVADE